ncbi:ribonuclease P protein subunit p14-like isoform X2 [Petromyzon marinus]|uniref:Ribonuclease P protein subunit p14-like isoform X2 n=1 Tax=Petromyzon marinus TaxID=7757 RepID=A0AAJ7U2L1_PETMA|nr:ribonuclease P protein subunit p14-like isoform X2 [Petromyzon marinus]XP_032827506.1 ribonuclease P protein subunit p14-like isoform X2 [Petromyzon marinus]
MRGVGPRGREAAFEKIVINSSCQWFYLRARLECEEEGVRLNEAEFRLVVTNALRELHGEVGAALPFDVIRFDARSQSCILRVISSGLVRLWASLSLAARHQGFVIAVHIQQVSPFLLSLSGNSRDLRLD